MVGLFKWENLRLGPAVRCATEAIREISSKANLEDPAKRKPVQDVAFTKAHFASDRYGQEFLDPGNACDDFAASIDCVISFMKRVCRFRPMHMSLIEYF